MSYCKVVFFKEGVPSGTSEWSNSWAGAAYIWDKLFDKYLRKDKYDTWLMNYTDLWKLAERQDIPDFMRAVHISTFDRAIVRKEHFKRFCSDLREFVKFFGGVSHLTGWADVIEQNLDFEAVGFYHTSVAEDPWHLTEEEKLEEKSKEEKIDEVGQRLDKEVEDELIPYNINKKKNHFEVYDYLEDLKGNQDGNRESVA